MPRAKSPRQTATVRSRTPGVNASELARLLAVSREAVRKWTLAGCPRLDSGDYILAEVVTWRIERAVEAERTRVAAERKPQNEMSRKLAAEAAIKEHQLEQLRGTSIPADVHDEAIGRVIGGFNAVAKGQLTRFERDIVRATTAVEARTLTAKIRAALMEGAHKLADDLDAEAAELTTDAA